MAALASAAVHSSLVAVACVAVVAASELDLVLAELPSLVLDDQILKIGCDLLEHYSKNLFINKHFPSTFFVKKFTFEFQIFYLFCDDCVPSVSLPFGAGGGPSPSSAIKLRYSSSIFACELLFGGPPWPGRFALQSLAM